MGRIVAMDEGAEGGELGADVRPRRQPLHAGPPLGAASGRGILDHPGVLEHEGDVRARRRELRRTRHLPGEDLEVEHQLVVREPGHVALQDRIEREIGARREAVRLVLVPVELHPNAAQPRVLREPVELRAHVGREQVGMAHDAVRPAGLVGHRLHPCDLGLEALRRPVRLHVDRPGHPATGDVLQVLVHEVIAPDRLVGAEDPRLHRPGQPRQVGPAPDVVMGIDDREQAHCDRISRGSVSDMDGRYPGPAWSEPRDGSDPGNDAASGRGRPARKRTTGPLHGETGVPPVSSRDTLSPRDTPLPEDPAAPGSGTGWRIILLHLARELHG